MQIYVLLEMLTRGIVIETKAINSHYKVVFIYSKQINRDIFLLRFVRITQMQPVHAASRHCVNFEVS
jgi:3-dehydroquinate synthase class II